MYKRSRSGLGGKEAAGLSRFRERDHLECGKCGEQVHEFKALKCEMCGVWTYIQGGACGLDGTETGKRPLWRVWDAHQRRDVGNSTRSSGNSYELAGWREGGRKEGM